MKQFFQINQLSGHVYEIPVAVVANHRASYYHRARPVEFPTLAEAMADTLDLFKDDLNEVREWFFGEMNPSDIEQHARLIRFTPPEVDWNEGDWSYHDHPALVGELTGEAIMKSPVEFVATVMTEARQLCNVTVLNDQEGQPFGAVVMIMGSPSVVGAYITALQITGDQITAMPPGTPSH